MILRECFVLMLGIAVSLLASLVGNAGQDFGALAAAILITVIFCLIRTGSAQLPPTDLAPFRRLCASLALSLALISLLLFEMGVALFAGAPGIPAEVWLVVAAFGIGYIALFIFAQALTSTAQPTYVPTEL